MFEFFEGLVNIAIHADAYGAFVVVPFEVHSDVLFCFSVNFERVFCTDTGYEMINVLLVCIFDTEVVNHEGEGNVSCAMEKETFSTGCLVVSKFFQVCHQIIMCYFPRLFEAIPCLIYPRIYIAVTDEWL